jgi:glycosyltransferase involved in cell wall biosynthesis
MRTSRVLLVSSRWESGPIVAFEALCSGTTVVGPAWVPACRWLAPDAGRCFTRRSATALGAAVVSELQAWDAGHRDPAAVAARWRPWFDPAEVCRRFCPHDPRQVA